MSYPSPGKQYFLAVQARERDGGTRVDLSIADGHGKVLFRDEFAVGTTTSVAWESNRRAWVHLRSTDEVYFYETDGQRWGKNFWGWSRSGRYVGGGKPPPLHAPPKGLFQKDQALIPGGALDVIRRLARELAGQRWTSGQAAVLIGSKVESPTGGLPLRVVPKAPAFAKATVASHPDSNELAYVELRLSGEMHLSVGELAAAFGAYSQPPRVHPDSPERLVFHRAVEGQAAYITLIAELSGGEPDVEHPRVESITLRCDARDDGG